MQCFLEGLHLCPSFLAPAHADGLPALSRQPALLPGVLHCLCCIIWFYRLPESAERGMPIAKIQIPLRGIDDARSMAIPREYHACCLSTHTTNSSEDSASWVTNTFNLVGEAKILFDYILLGGSDVEHFHMSPQNRALSWSILPCCLEIKLSRGTSSQFAMKSSSRVECVRILL